VGHVQGHVRSVDLPPSRYGFLWAGTGPPVLVGRDSPDLRWPLWVILAALAGLTRGLVAVAFGSAEYFLLMLLALVMVSNLTTGSQLKALIATLFGHSIAMVGIDPQMSVQWFTFGVPLLSDGIDFALIAIALLALPEAFTNMAARTTSHMDAQRIQGSTWMSREDWRCSAGPYWRGSILGFLIGVLPGPLFTLGIPGSATTALLLFVFMMYGLQPGPQLFDTHPELIWTIIASMYIGNVMLLVLNLPLVGLFAQLLKTPRRCSTLG
jgi:putative tricarboxylic transport membrane protein